MKCNQKLADLRLEILDLFSSTESDAVIFHTLMEKIALASKATVVLGRRRDIHGTYRVGVWPSKEAISRSPLLEQAARVSLSPFDPQNPPIRPNPHLGVFYLMPGMAAPNGPSYMLVLYSDADPFSREELDFVNELTQIIPPLLRTRDDKQLARETWNKTEQGRRDSEAELHRLFEESRDMIYMTNSEDVFASINTAGVTLLGAESYMEVLGRRFSDYAMNREDRTYFLRRIRESGFLQDYEIILVGEKFCIETAHVVKHPDGSFAGIQGIIKDISERISNERALWLANMELAETNAQLQKTQVAMIQQDRLASIGQLAAGVAHEINNPLGFLKSNWESLKDYIAAMIRAWTAASGFIPPEILKTIRDTEDLDFILQELPPLFEQSTEGFNRIIEIVSQLKAFSKIDKEGHFAPYDLEKGIYSTLAVANNELKYVADVSKDFGGVPLIMADGGAINQVILNLIVNAAQAIASLGRKDKGHILVRTRSDGAGISCLVRDDGPGFDDAVRTKLFDPFFTTKEVGKGTGLGLSISWDIIVMKHHGTITVNSTPGIGAEFTFWIPLNQASIPEAP